MIIILITVITQGVSLPPNLKGQISGSILINSGFFQAVGVISFGKLPVPFQDPTPLIEIST